MNQIKKKNLEAISVQLRPLRESDYSDEYLSWLEDQEINRYLETRWEEQTEEKIKSFINSMESSQHDILYGIFHDHKHIGNIKIGLMNWNHMSAHIGYFIGSRDFWGKGLATEAVRRVTQFAFEELNLNKCNAGVYSGNPGSIRVLEKVGYNLEGCQRNEFKGPDGWEDHLLYGCLREEFL